MLYGKNTGYVTCELSYRACWQTDLRWPYSPKYFFSQDAVTTSAQHGSVSTKGLISKPILLLGGDESSHVASLGILTTCLQDLMCEYKPQPGYQEKAYFHLSFPAGP